MLSDIKYPVIGKQRLFSIVSIILISLCSVNKGSYVVVQYTSKRMRLLYVGVVKLIKDDDVTVEFLKKSGDNFFITPANPETDVVNVNDIVEILPEPNVISGTARCSAKRKFDVDLSCING